MFIYSIVYTSIMSLHPRDNPVKRFYNHLFFEKGLSVRPREIEEYLEKERDCLRNIVKRGESVIDIGCGTGRVLRGLQDIAGMCVGVDYSEHHADMARKMLKDTDIFLADAKKTNFKDDLFDCVLCVYNTFGNLGEDKVSVLREMRRIMNPNGRIILSVYSENALDTQLRFYKMLGLNVENVDDYALYLREGLISERFTEERLRKLVEEAGGLCVDIKTLTSISYICELRRCDSFWCYVPVLEV